MNQRLIIPVVVIALACIISGPALAADIGHVRDEDTLSRAYSSLQNILDANFDHPDALLLFTIGEKAFEVLDPELFTGYSVKNRAEATSYDGAQTIRYGHADVWHLIELLSVMRHYGFNPHLYLESRISSYIHYYEWGPPGPGVQVAPIDDEKAYVYVKEYDVLFEFADGENVTFLDEFLRKYAQKRIDDEDRHDLIRGSWYVPLYSSTVEQTGYRLLKEVRVTYGNHYLVNYVSPEHVNVIAEGLENVAGPAFSVEVHDIWVNEAFFAYVNAAS